MAIWGFYFVVKIILNYRGMLWLDIPSNIGFAIFLLLPTPKWLGKYTAVRWTRGGASFVFALLLLWHDSWLPPLMDAIAMIKQQGLPQKEYIFDFLSRYYDEKMITSAAGLFLVCYVVNRFVKLVPVTIVVMLALIPFNLMSQPDEQEMNAAIDGFYDGETTRVINLKKPEGAIINFDIVFLQVCSLARDDLKQVGLEHHPFFNQFQFLYTDFDSVTTYSGPAMVRLLKANCGQVPHSAIYEEMPKECYTMPALEWVGLQPWVALNHDGVYGQFAKEIAEFGHLKTPPMDLSGVQANQRMFDDSLVYDDYGVLEKWWQARLKSDVPAALYYNTVSLHDGSHWATDRDWYKRSRKELFREFASKMLDDFGKFFLLLEKSGRNVVVVLVPEHGLALRGGGTVQVPGLRDIPLPPITNVPVGIKLIGSGFNGQPFHQTVIDKPTSYLAVASLLASIIDKNPFNNDGRMPKGMIEDLPVTDHVAENQSAKVIRLGQDYYLLTKGGSWVKLQKSETE